MLEFCSIKMHYRGIPCAMDTQAGNEKRSRFFSIQRTLTPLICRPSQVCGINEKPRVAGLLFAA
jgi:hypothetical protein